MDRWPHYEEDDEVFPADAYAVRGHGGVAWRVYGWEIVPDEDTDWTGYEARTGRVVAVMVGDDRRFTFEPTDVTPLAREAYCGECGQVGCTHDGLDREAEGVEDNEGPTATCCDWHASGGEGEACQEGVLR